MPELIVYLFRGYLMESREPGLVHTEACTAEKGS